MNSFNRILFFLIIVSTFSVFGCLDQGEDMESATENAVDQTPRETVDSGGDWKDMELKDIATGEIFRISDFEGKPVLLESFAVWCPTCLEQQKEIKKLYLSEGDAIIHISLDTDPNENEDAVRDHYTRNEFDWYFAISPNEYTQSLIDEFGLEIVSAPSAPIVLIREDQSARLLPRGVKTADELKAEVEA